MMLTPDKELDFDHTIVLPSKNASLAVGMTLRGMNESGGVYFAEVEYVGGSDAIVRIISHTGPSEFKRGERVRFIFKS